MVLNVKALGWRFAAVFLVVVMAVAAWAVLLKDGSLKAVPKILPRVLPKTAVLTDWSNSCKVGATVWETSVVWTTMIYPPAGLAEQIGAYALLGFGSYATADACASQALINHIPFGSCHIVLGAYKATYNGAKYYHDGPGSICNV